jgi:hypothetical protein
VLGLVMVGASVVLAYLGVLRPMHERQIAQASNEAVLARNQEKLLRFARDIDDRLRAHNRQPGLDHWATPEVELEKVVEPTKGWGWHDVFALLAVLLLVAGSYTALSALAPSSTATPRATPKRTEPPSQVEKYLEEMECDEPKRDKKGQE